MRRVLATVIGIAGFLTAPASGSAAAPSLRTAVPVVKCTTSFGVEGVPEAWSAQQLPTQVSRSVAKRVAFYSNGRITILGPKGWTCSGIEGANGSGSLSVYPLGASGQQNESDTNVLVVDRDYTGHGPGADLVCGYFPSSPAAAFVEGIAPCSPLPDGTTTTFATPDIVEFENTDGRRGAVIYPQIGNESPGGVTVEVLQCRLEGKRRSLCQPIIDDFLVRNAPVVPEPIEPNQDSSFPVE